MGIPGVRRDVRHPGSGGAEPLLDSGGPGPRRQGPALRCVRPAGEADEILELLLAGDHDPVLVHHVYAARAIISEIGNSPTGFEERYGHYLVYTQEMADKLEEIIAKYDKRSLSRCRARASRVVTVEASTPSSVPISRTLSSS